MDQLKSGGGFIQENLCFSDLTELQAQRALRLLVDFLRGH